MGWRPALLLTARIGRFTTFLFTPQIHGLHPQRPCRGGAFLVSSPESAQTMRGRYASRKKPSTRGDEFFFSPIEAFARGLLSRRSGPGFCIFQRAGFFHPRCCSLHPIYFDCPASSEQQGSIHTQKARGVAGPCGRFPKVVTHRCETGGKRLPVMRRVEQLKSVSRHRRRVTPLCGHLHSGWEGWTVGVAFSAFRSRPIASGFLR